MRGLVALGAAALVAVVFGYAVRSGLVPLAEPVARWQAAVAQQLGWGPKGPAGGASAAGPVQAAAPGQGSSAIPVEVANVSVGRVTRQVAALGTLQASQSVTIQPEIAGKVTRVGFREGDRVKAGTVLVELDRSILAAELEQAKAVLALAESNYRRAETLAGQGTGTQRSRDEASTSFQTATAAVELARARLQKTQIVAPFDGVIGLTDATVGRFLGIGDRIVNLENIDLLKVDFRVPEIFLSAVRPGQPVAIAVDAFPGRSFTGTVYAIDPLVDVNGRAIHLKARVANAEGVLRPGLFARVQLEIEVRENALLVPEAAVVPQGQQAYVFQVIDGKVRMVRVALGERRAGEVEILAGLAAGDMVVSAGQPKLFEGAAVAIMPPRAPVAARG